MLASINAALEGLSLTPSALLLLFCIVFLAGVVDSIAGGGGLISIPGYLFVGIPIHITYGTNKFANMFGAAIASVQYARSKTIHWGIAVISIPAAVAGSWLGAQVAIRLSEQVLTLTLMFILPISAGAMLFGTRKKEHHQQKTISRLRTICSALTVGLLCGFYDGFFGPGTGTFMILGYTSLLGMEFIQAAGTAKLVNTASNIGAIIPYLLSGRVLFTLGIPCALFSIIGNVLGAKMAVKNGERLVRPLIFLVILLLMIKLVGQLLT